MCSMVVIHTHIYIYIYSDLRGVRAEKYSLSNAESNDLLVVEFP